MTAGFAPMLRALVAAALVLATAAATLVTAAHPSAPGRYGVPASRGHHPAIFGH
ncbi:MAG: hypothetical protein IRY89_09495 [Pseudolabrys sp.]|nr:hypothetical protein [Pseudolabrys sp.]